MTDVYVIPERTAEIELDGDYVGIKATVRRNLPMGVLVDLSNLDTKNVAGLWSQLASVFISSNLADKDGPIDVTTVADWRRVPSDTAVAMLRAATEALQNPFEPTPTESSPRPSPVTA